MTNFEFFKNTILEMEGKYQTMAVVRDVLGNGYIGNCAFTRCRDCLLDKPKNESCIKNVMNSFIKSMNTYINKRE